MTGSGIEEELSIRSKTVYDSPLSRRAMRWVAWIIFRGMGWKPAGKRPDIPKYVIIAAPHTSNWDFLYTLCLAFLLNIKAVIMMKGAWFRWPAGRFFRWMGALPVDRSRSTDVVARAVQAFREQSHMVLVVPPSGTRRQVMYWKTGFYHIARGAGVPIVLGYLDYRQKVGGIGPTVYPTGNMTADMQRIREFYAGIEGKHPHRMQDFIATEGLN
ncbi:MAG: lysophospholipid acyltransferase family protein [Deltaproteobacteria bacterium]|nr:lysophospholipid acyltransferase family protein [Deltaproteobacteria bacterium]